MRICILGNASSVHIVQWCNELASHGFDIHLVTKHPVSKEILPVVKTYQYSFPGVIGYFLMIPYARRLVRSIKPDIVHAHYASGYGTTARFLGFKPWILSVWGSDVFNFPKKTVFHSMLVKSNLRSASAVASTSIVMAKEVLRVCPDVDDLKVTPFGVDCELFSKQKMAEDDKNMFVVGTVKSMNESYGIDVLIRAFAYAKFNLGLENARLLLVGAGESSDLKALAASLGVRDDVCFVGGVLHSDVPNYLAKLDIYLALSRSESFGVSILEASACGVPVIATRVGGLPEVVVDGETGFLVDPEDYVSAAIKIVELFSNHELRDLMGRNGRDYVDKNFSWNVCVNIMSSLYHEVESNE
ncbi:glycosyltransferase [uncultured Alcanivorax sp.]|uniref:glycosyltransferase n=1 Tax=uncultured Alcanivorax sp. TaxID=191215 RepID=UPI002610B9FB|nr:glycosyltransferase [uncultured Alcanivorax sp.]